MIRSKGILKSLQDSPRLIFLRDSHKQDAVGLLNLKNDNKIDIHYSLGWYKNGSISDSSISGTFEGGFVLVNSTLGSSSVAYKFEANPHQKLLEYNYLLLANEIRLIKIPAYSRLILAFPVFFTDIDTVPKGLFTHTFENGSITLGLSSSEHWERFPPRHEKLTDTVWIELKLKNNHDIHELERYKDIITRFVTSNTGQVLQPFETLFAKRRRSDWRDEHNNYVLYVNHADPIPIEGYLKNIDVDHLISFSKAQEVVDDLCVYIEKFDNFRMAAYLHSSYIQYRQEKMYIDSQLSVLFAGLDSIFNAIFQPTIDVRRNKVYDQFLKDIKNADIKIKPSLRSFLKKGKNEYSNNLSYEKKLTELANYNGVIVNKKWLKKVADLRNSIAHGKPINWFEYLNNFIDEDGERTEKVNPDKLAAILLLSIKRYSRESR